jgi:putative ABC transport system ATP-binding protein
MTIDLKNITLTFPDGDRRVTALNDVSLHVEAGSVVAITGASGSGKSTLLAVASTLLTPDSGTVTIDGIDAANLDAGQRSALRRERIGIVFQQSNLLQSLTAREQLLVMNELGGKKRPQADVAAKADELLTAVGLTGHEHKRPHQLSGGQRQRVNIARAFMEDPSVFVVDEPTASLDQESGASIIELILRMTAAHRTATILVTHDLRHLASMDDHYVMQDGVLTRQTDHAANNLIAA